MDIDPPSQEFTSDVFMKPQTYPPRYTTTGLEDLLSSWNLHDPAPPPAHAHGREEIGGGWQEVGLLELLEGVVLCVGWASGGTRALQLGWACVAVLGIYRLGQRQALDSGIAAGAALLRAALPLPVFASWIGTSARVEALLWDTVCVGVIVAAKASSRTR